MKNRRRYSAAKRPVSKRSILSIILAAVSAAAFLVCVIISASFRGNAASYTGAIGLASALMALYGCVLGIKELAAEKKTYKKSYSGAIAGGIIFIIWLAVFLKGIKG